MSTLGYSLITQFFLHTMKNNFYQSVAMLGFEENEIFLESEGHLTALPLSIQRIPFYIGKTKIEGGIPVDEKT